jgi:hypothetical protein
MDKKTFEEPDVVTPRPKYSAYRNYDINIWSQDDRLINITAYRLSVYESDPEEVSGTDWDEDYFTWSLSANHEPDWPVLDWLVCDKLGLPDWTSLDGIDEWDTYHSNTADYLSETAKAPPRAVVEWLDSLPEYEPRKV